MVDRSFSARVLRWYDVEGRKDLPWQREISAYKVWLSEVMLQQTQVSTVIPYFNLFLSTFPTVQALAQANEDEVMHLWSGLGYYSRARNLHRAAKLIVSEFNGKFPDDLDALQLLPGVGRSTAGAIRSSAFEKRAAILDGNVKRVLARHFAIEGWAGKSSVMKLLWQASEAVTPDNRSRAYTQAIMDLGALICKRSRPDCNACPVQSTCIAHNSQTIDHYPGKKPRKVMPVRQTRMLVIQNDRGEILLEKRPPVGVWAGLWSLPEADQFDSGRHNIESALENKRAEVGSSFRHTFSHYHLDITPVFGSLELIDGVSEAGEKIWYDPKNPSKVGLAAPVSKLIASIYGCD